ncbi:hypothetical protein P4C99_21525 [Pontiellaceae bacterium B1224]|nr:hypothetical protein [Pontiellaceae bacterium B1224]
MITRYIAILLAQLLICSVARSEIKKIDMHYDMQKQVISYTQDDISHEINSLDYKFSTWIDVSNGETEKKGWLINEKYLIFSALLNNSRDILYIYDTKSEHLFKLYNVTEWTVNKKLGWAAIITQPVYSQSFQDDPCYMLIVNGKLILSRYGRLTNLSCDKNGILGLMIDDTYLLNINDLFTINVEDYFPEALKHGEKPSFFGLNRCPKKTDSDPSK